MAEVPTSRKWLWWVVAGVAALAVVAAVALSVSGPDGRGATMWRSLLGGRASDSPTVSVTATGSIPGPGAGMTTTSPSGGSPSQGSGSGSSGSGSKPAPGAPSADKTGFALRVAWWNDTEDRAPEGFVLSWGSSGTWSPPAGVRSAVTTVGPLTVGAKTELRIRMDGPQGATIVVPVTIAANMVSGSEQDGLHIEVRDDNIRVIGNAVENTERNYPRP